MLSIIICGDIPRMLKILIIVGGHNNTRHIAISVIYVPVMSHYSVKQNMMNGTKYKFRDRQPVSLVSFESFGYSEKFSD